MKDLIEALTIFLKYDNGSQWPTHCEHDQLFICSVDRGPADMDKADAARLDELGFNYAEADGDGWYSFRFGSA